MNIITLTLNPALDRTMYFDSFTYDATNRAVSKSQMTPGGKGINVARVLKCIYGVDALCRGFSGGRMGVLLEELLRLENISFDFVKTDAETRMNIKIIDGNGLSTEANEAGGPIKQEEYEELLERLSTDIDKNPDFIVLSGSFPQGVDKNVYNFIIEKARSKNIKVALDCDGDALKRGLDALPYIIKPNKSELENLVGEKFSTKFQAADAAKRIYLEKGVNILCTLGSDGAFYCGDEGLIFVDSPKVEVKGFSGAGDTFLASFLYNMKISGSVEGSLVKSSAAAAAKVERAGLPSVERIEEFEKKITVSTFNRNGF